MAKLTKRTVDAAGAGARDRFLWDDELPGFGLRVYPSGAKVYLFQWKRDGRTRRKVLGRHGAATPDEARRLALADLAEVQKGNDPAEARDRRESDITVTELCDRRVAEGCPRTRPGREGRVRIKEGTAATYRSGIERHVKPLLGHRKLGGLKRTDMVRFQSDVAAGRTALVERTAPQPGARERRIARFAAHERHGRLAVTGMPVAGSA